MEAHCVNLELKYQNQTLKEGQHGQFLKVKSNEAKIKRDIDVIETINIKLEHKVAKLLKENETLKRNYKELSDSIKTTRAKTIEHTTSLITQNVEFKAQLHEEILAIASIKNKVKRKLTGNSVNTKWVPTGKTFTSSTTKVDNEPTNGSNDDITNQYECEQTLDVSAGTLNLSAGDKTATSRQELELLFHHQITMLRLYGGGGIPFQLKSDSLPHAYAQTTKTYYKHQDSRIMKAQELNAKNSANSDIKDNSSKTKLQGRLLASFQDNAKYKHVGQETRSQGGKDDQD
ncbi:hypothetical protein Tco_1071104 [Tanacetum coccineum]|uniref:Uncharacterized protein n=1 Tax=Tanacetum coccineum TaxID=301880 RepID=A0ABQ5HNB2_9ASTR